MKVLSLFDGCGMSYQALKNLGIQVDKYYASEVDKYAIQIAMKNHPDTIHLGDVCGIKDIQDIDLLIGGSPCQDLSIAGKREGLEGKRSGLFREYVRILKETKPKYFLLENVASMSKENKQIITDALGVEPILINSALLTAQNRKRLYWTNIPNITQPIDKGIVLKDVLEEEVNEKYYMKPEIYEKIKYMENKRLSSLEGKSSCLNTMQGGHRQPKIMCIGGLQKNASVCFDKSTPMVAAMGMGGGHTPMIVLDRIRKLTVIECERLQGLPDNYTEGVSNSQRYKMIGNGFTVPVIEHILSFT